MTHPLITAHLFRLNHFFCFIEHWRVATIPQTIFDCICLKHVVSVKRKKILGRVAQSVTCIGNRCESDCSSRGREFDQGPVMYFRRD